MILNNKNTVGQILPDGIFMLSEIKFDHIEAAVMKNVYGGKSRSLINVGGINKRAGKA